MSSPEPVQISQAPPDPHNPSQADDNHGHPPLHDPSAHMEHVPAPVPGQQDPDPMSPRPTNDNSLHQNDNDASDPFASDLLWQASNDVGLHFQPATATFPANVLTSDEPTLPNLGKKRPIDPDMDFLFETAPGEQDAHQIDVPEPTPMTGAPSPFALPSPVAVHTRTEQFPMSSPVSFSGSSPRSPAGIGGIVGMDFSPTSLVPMMAAKSPSSLIRSPVGQVPLRQLKQEVASTEFSDVPLGETETVAAAKLSSPAPPVTRSSVHARKPHVEPVAPAPVFMASAIMSSSEDGRSDVSRPASSNGGGSDPGGKPDPPAGDSPMQWPSLSFGRKYVFLMYLGVLFSEFLDLFLGFIYLATYHFGCYALVSPFEGGLDTAYSMFYVALVSSVSAGFFLHIHMQQIAQVVVDKYPGDTLRAILYLADSEWEQWSNGAINQAKLLGLGQLVLRDSLGMLVVLTNLGPHDANVLTLTKLVLSSLSLARMGSHLFLAFAARVLTCGASPRTTDHRSSSTSKSDRMHDSVVFKSLRWILTFIATCMWLVVPLAFFAAPDELSRYIYIAESNLPTARIHVLCIPPTPQAFAAAGGNPAQIAKFCNPGVCMHSHGSVSNYQAYNVESKAWVTLPNAVICASRNVPIASRAGPARTHLIGIPGLPLPARFHAMIPCQPPITGNVTRLPVNALWPGMFDLPYYTPLVTGDAHRANFTRWHRDVYRMDIAEHFAPTQTVHQYLPGDKVAQNAECVRRWVATTDFYGFLDLVKGGLMVPEEVNVRYQTYTVAIEVVQRDRMAGPLACSFDYVGAVQRGVEVVSNKERLAKMGQDVARLLAAVTGRTTEVEVTGKTASVSTLVQQPPK